jgi:hypothetical protein
MMTTQQQEHLRVVWLLEQQRLMVLILQQEH